MCSQYVTGDFFNALKALIEKDLGSDAWELKVDLGDPDKQTLLFYYPTLDSNSGYIAPAVKIEMGARAEHWPVTEKRLTSYMKEALKDEVFEEPVFIRVLNAEGTFWEKATILHQYANIPEEKTVPLRLSRHYYDFYCLLTSPTKAVGLENSGLLERVANHKSIYFASSWAQYHLARKGTLKLMPSIRIEPVLRKDYLDMENMFFAEYPKWELILETLSIFENEFNSS